MALNTNRFFIDATLFNQRVDCRQHRIQRIFAGLTEGVRNIGHQHHVAIANVKRGIDTVTRRRVAEIMHIL